MPNPRTKLGRIREYYDRLSNSYGDLYGSEQWKKQTEALEEIEKQKPGLLIDVGCGDGTLLTRAAKLSRTLVGVDVSLGMLMKARELVGQETSLVQAEAGHLPFRDRSADCIMSVSLADDQNAGTIIAEALRVISREGTIAITILHPGRSLPQGFEDLVAKRTTLSTRETLVCFRKNQRGGSLPLRTSDREMDGQ